MAQINFRYDYPYCGYGEDGRFQTQWSESRVTLNRCYTYPMVFNTTVPSCSHIKVSIEIENTGSGTIYERSWDFMVCKSNGSWVDVTSFTLPSDGKYTVDCDISNLSISKFAFVPSSNPGSNRTWDSWFGVEQMTITEAVELQPLSTGMFQYGVFANRSGVSQRLNEVHVNIDGVLKQATDILVNVDGLLVSIPPVYSGYLKTVRESVFVYAFTPPVDGTYTITEKRLSGDHEMRLYDNSFTPMHDSYFYTRSFALTAGSVFYIAVTHYMGVAESESYIQIYKEE